jgi:flagellum-specific ATP synthase
MSQLQPESRPEATSTRHALETLDQLFAGGLPELSLVRAGGIVTEVTPSYCRISGLSRLAKLGQCVALSMPDSEQIGEVIRIEEAAITVKPFGVTDRIGLGARAWLRGFIGINPHESWKGRVIDALCRPIDGAGDLNRGACPISMERAPPAPMRRSRVRTPVKTGVRVIDLFSPLCSGQRVGIFAGSGIGKSTLLAMLARAQGFDTVVISLVGERGREVREFIEDTLGPERSKVVVVVATADESPMMRRIAPRTALSVAEHFRDRGDNVLLIIDSVTRFAHALREVSLAAGEPPVARGYPPGVFSELPKLLERAGPGEDERGSITAVVSVLVDGDDHNDPVADCLRGILDGHIVLDRTIADQGRYPAVSVLGSISRLARNVWSPEQAKLVSSLRALISRFEDTRDLRVMGGYQRGADAELDQAVDLVPKLYEALKQTPGQSSVDAFQEVARSLSG